MYVSEVHVLLSVYNFRSSFIVPSGGISFTVLLLLFLLSYYVIFLWCVCLVYGPCA